MNQYEVINTRHTLITGTHHLCEILLTKYGKCAALKSIRCYFWNRSSTPPWNLYYIIHYASKL